MAMNVQIQCINKNPCNDVYRRITIIGGVRDGQRWSLTLDEAIAAAKNGQFHFWTMANGERVRVEVAVSRFGNEYLKTEVDADEPNYLLRLPECL